MSPRAPNSRLAAEIVARLDALGVRLWCACAGARNSPLFALLCEQGAANGRQLVRFYEERSAGFFALGAIKRTREPVAVVTTSGTAAAELLPAMIEAHYSGLPLVAVTADRPRRYRGTGAPQSIEQVGLFGPYAHGQWDLAAGDCGPESFGRLDGPIHLNVCFEEPLLEPDPIPIPVPVPSRPAAAQPRAAFDFGAVARSLDAFQERCRRPLVLVGPLAAPERPAVRAFLRRIAAPLLAESASGLRADPELAHLELFGGERAIHRALSAAPDLCDGILRVGGVPVTRLWRDLEDKLARLPVLSLSASPFSGLSRGGLVHTPLDSGLAEVGRPSGWRDDLAPFRAADRALRARTESLLDAEPKSEPGMIRRLSRLVPIDSPLYLGNSLPIREWDLAAMTENRLADTGVNRGANGIDGQLSTFFGFCPPGIESWAVLGDLTALYDLGAPWVLDQLADRRWVLAIVNNGGGAIFSRMFRQIEFQNRHRTRFDAWAAMWDLRHETWESVPDRWRPQAPTIVELLPDPTSTDRFWAGYEALWK